ncbi:hypothetical protein AMTRI_Chr05g57360 [Amborella trichopoda]|uniref:Auxin-responsive protein n=1 Tax=Amborella trichopoda TaxID=13333 RepID=W1NPM0_AMBTC|nr:auxin-responsive protein IAA27 [Amborella trichopoda]XP_011620574.1 auxin-responsive protein IAA27 [Amborella trichopoda]XP_011620575.1 auxin-responsive protein IAA27 [Amborella trichopoda]XP_020518266.1 auxin-responsive protein IAA27 [Amborella trichopoda]ERM98671.1 hypothetical protein AMTR_s00109p00120700 [Amborella trichopoda]|eukprot:XP_006833393.1 auxin-responsive protein IAA27 [Amborella trichopoda]
MTPPLGHVDEVPGDCSLKEHDYIGLSEVSSMERTSLSKEENGNSLNLKETELRLGLPGSGSPDRKKPELCLLGPLRPEEKGIFPLVSPKNVVSGAKRGISDVIDGVKKGVASDGKWAFNGGSGSEVGSGVWHGNGSHDHLSPGFLSPRKGTSNGKDTAQNGVSGSGHDRAKDQSHGQVSPANEHGVAPAAKAQVVGWPPIRSYRKNTMAANPAKNSEEGEGKQGLGCLYVKVSMDGAPYLRKVDLKTYLTYTELSSALEKMFSCFTIGQYGPHGAPGRDGLTESRLMDLLNGSEYVLTYEDKDGDWMLVGDVPWDMFIGSCRRLRIMKGSEAIGLAPRAMEKCKARN